MTVRELIEELMKLENQDDDIFLYDSEWGICKVNRVEQDLHHVTAASGRELPKVVSVLCGEL